MKTLKYKCIKDFHMTYSTEEDPDVPFVEGNIYKAQPTSETGELLFTDEYKEDHYMHSKATLENDDYTFSEHLVPTEY